MTVWEEMGKKLIFCIQSTSHNTLRSTNPHLKSRNMTLDRELKDPMFICICVFYKWLTSKFGSDTRFHCADLWPRPIPNFMQPKQHLLLTLNHITSEPRKQAPQKCLVFTEWNNSHHLSWCDVQISTLYLPLCRILEGCEKMLA